MSEQLRRCVERVVAALGGRTAAARKLDVTPAAVSQWKDRGLPMHQVPLLAALSGIAEIELRAGIKAPRKRGPKPS